MTYRLYHIYIYIYPIGSMYGIYANIGGILMGSMLPYIAYMDPMGIYIYIYFRNDSKVWNSRQPI